jgi:hypothetical protein
MAKLTLVPTRAVGSVAGALLFGCVEEGAPPPPPEDVTLSKNALVASWTGQGVADDGKLLSRCWPVPPLIERVNSSSVTAEIVSSRKSAYARKGIKATVVAKNAMASGHATVERAEESVETDLSFTVSVGLNHVAYRAVLDPGVRAAPRVDRLDPRFSALCGSGAVSSVSHGGVGSLDVRLSFADKETKSAVRAALAVALSKGGVKAQMDAALDQLSSMHATNVRLSLRAHQAGGHSVNLGSLLLGDGTPGEAAENVKNCSGSLRDCLQIVKNAVQYFANPDVMRAFAQDPAPIDWEVLPWENFNLAPSARPNRDVILARDNLALLQEEALDDAARVGVRRSFGSATNAESKQAQKNLSAIAVALGVECLDDLAANPGDPVQSAECVRYANEESPEGLRSLGWRPLVDAAPPTKAPCLVQVYRFYGNGTDHVHSTSTNFGQGAGYSLEFADGWVAREQIPGTVAWYGLYHPGGHNDHFTSTDPNEGSGGAGYVNEGVKWYLPIQQLPGTVPLYRVYKGGDQSDHFLTRNGGEGSGVGYTNEGVRGYIWPTLPEGWRACP